MSDQPVYLLTVRYTVEYNVAVEGTAEQVHRMAYLAPTPKPDDEHPAFTSFLTDDAKRFSVDVVDITDIEVCGGYVDISDAGGFIDRLDF